MHYRHGDLCYNSLMEEAIKTETWNKKRIIISLIVLLLLIAAGIFLRTRVLGENLSGTGASVKGASIEEKDSGVSPKIDIQETIKEKINSLKQEASNLDLSEIASSSPQVQKIINDIKALEEYPTNQLKELCRKICGL